MVDWGGGNGFEQVTTENTLHPFATAGVHTIRFRNLNNIYINDQADKEKYTSIEQWGTSVWDEDMSYAFFGASNLIMSSSAGTPEMGTVTDMNGMFQNTTSFNGDISGWNTALVEEMGAMFSGATAFNQNLGGWNTASVEDMSDMFEEATSFNGDISGWNTASVTEMTEMFSGASSFNGDISGWNVASVEDMNGMFEEATSFNGDIDGWNTASVEDMSGMFVEATSFNGDISGWNTALVENMESMFDEATSFDQDLGGWNVGAVTNMRRMFASVTLSLANYDSLLVGWNRQPLQTGVHFDGGTSKYSSAIAHTARANMISSTGHDWTIDDGGRVQADDAPTAIFLSSTSIAENAGANAVVGTLSTNGGASSYTYALATGTGDTDNSSFRISGTALQLIASADYETKTTYAVRLKVDGVMPAVGKQFTITVTDVNEQRANNAPVFAGGATARVAYAENATTAVTIVTATDADEGQTVTLTLSGDDEDQFSITPLGVLTFKIAPDYEMPTDVGMNNVYEITITATDDGTPAKMVMQILTITVTDVVNEGGNPADDHFVLKITTTAGTNASDKSFTFYSQDTDYMVDWGGGNGFEQVTTENTLHPFATAGVHTIRFRNLNNIYINDQADKEKYTSIEQWGTSVWDEDMSYAFFGASNLIMSSSAGTPEMGTVTDMAGMFAFATSFNGDIGGWNVASVTEMTEMFSGASSFNGDIDGWNTASVTEMSEMFQNATFFDGDISGWNVASVTEMSDMFNGATAFNGDIDGWNTASVTEMTEMFNGATAFNGDISGWNVASVEDMNGMFEGATAFNGDIDGWNTASVEDMSGMFAEATSFDQDLSGWDVGAVESMEDMFLGATLSPTNYNSLLVGWDRQNLTPRVTFHGGNSLYSSATAETARTNMITSDMWRITDGGKRTTNMTPTNIFLSSSRIAENAGANAVVGMLSNTDTGGTYAYSLVDGEGDNNNELFNILGTSLRLTASADYETKVFYEVRINVNDGMNDFAKSFTIIVTNLVNEGGNPTDHFVLKITTTAGTNANDKSFTFYSQDMDYMVNWGESSDFEQVTTGDASHTFATAGVHTIRFTNLNDIYINYQAGREKYTSIEQWGTSVWNPDMASAFLGASNLTMNLSAGTPDMSMVTNMSFMFEKATSFNGDIGNWNTASVEYMYDMFNLATSFNGDISGWNTASVREMDSMFDEAISFNQDIGNWNTASVTDMNGMFEEATSFNGDIGNWNTASVEYMYGMFEEATSFNQDIGNWNTASVTDMTGMFKKATSFNQDIGGWNVEAVLTMWDMFLEATSFNGDIGNWNTAKVWDMTTMFAEAASFNQDLGGWNVEAVELMTSMFRHATAFNGDISGWNPVVAIGMYQMFAGATSFNQDISGWNTASVFTMFGMFARATSFNQDIGNWNTARVQDMTAMFKEATSFNQDIGGWNVEAVLTMWDMFYGVTLSTSNYDSLLVGWNRQTLQTGVPFHGGNSLYISSEAQTARKNMVSSDQWRITDGGRVNDHAPIFTSGTTVDVAEGTTAVTTVTATDADVGQTVTFTLTGGADEFELSITSAGVLTFDLAPDFETPRSAAGSNEYEVIITATDGQTPAMTAVQTLTITVTDVDEALGLEALTGIAVYPNPAGAVLHIHGVEGNARYTLSGIDGKVLKRGKLRAGTADHSVAIPSLKKGIYLLQLTTGKGSVTRKIVKE